MQPLGHVVITFLVLLAGGAVTLASGAVQLRGLLQGLRGGDAERRLRRATLASGVSLGAISGTALALVAGGPGALLWMWVASLLGMALTFVEVTLAVRLRDADSPRSAAVGPIQYMREGLGRVGKPLSLLFALTLPLAALAMAGLFQGQQTAQLLAEVAHADPVAVGAALALATLAVLLARGERARRLLLLAVPLALAAYAALTCVVLLSEPAALAEALSTVLAGASEGEAWMGGAAGGSLLIAVQHGFVRATFANASGLGVAACADEVAEVSEARTAGRVAMIAPAIHGVVIAGLTGLAILVSGAQARREIAQRDNESGRVTTIALERPHARGLIPSLERGQVVVLPEDTPLQPMHRYPFVMRANPRGSQVGKFDEKENAVAIPVWEITQNVDTIVFRSADPDRRENPAYDRRIAVTQEHRVLANGVEALILHPVDESLDLGELRRDLRGPYVQLDDFYFVGAVAEATHPRYGEHLAMFDDPSPDAPPNPNLRTVVSFGFRGPYLYASGDLARPPTAMIGIEGFQAPVGTRLTLRMETPARGSALGYLDKSAGELRTPAWSFLQASTQAVLRHVDDPSQDLVVPVDHRVGEDGSLRFTSAAPEIVDFARADEMKNYRGPFLLAAPFEFEVEVHTATRLDPQWSDRVALVPVHDRPEPEGGTGEPYVPHPAEVFSSDLQGPHLVQEGAVLVAAALAESSGKAGGIVLAGIAFVLVVATAITWATAAARTLASVLGPTGALACKLAMPACLVAGASAPLATVLALAEPLMLAALALNLVALLPLLPRALASK